MIEFLAGLFIANLFVPKHYLVEERYFYPSENVKPRKITKKMLRKTKEQFDLLKKPDLKMSMY